uniref:Uncharacterized protein n=1 Tax=Cannabis sativa TaxID=3483 RepID=A0A803P3X0_CANSA
MAKRNCSMVTQLAYELEMLRAEHANAEQMREKATKALAVANTRMEVIIKYRAKMDIQEKEKKLTVLSQEYDKQVEIINDKIINKTTLERKAKHHTELQQKVEEVEKKAVQRPAEVETKLDSSEKAHE